MSIFQSASKRLRSVRLRSLGRCATPLLLVMASTIAIPDRLAVQAAESKSGAISPKLIAQVDGFPDWVTSVAISPDGLTIAAGSFENVRLFRPEGQSLAEWNPGPGFVRALTFSADGTTLYTGGYKKLAVWNLTNDDSDPQQVATLDGHRGYIEHIALSPDGHRLACCGEDGTTQVWDLAEPKRLFRLEGDHTPVLGVAFSPDGKMLATAAGDTTRLSAKGNVRLWDATSGDLIRDLPQHKRAATSALFTADGRLLSASFDEHVNVVDSATGELLGFFGAHSRPVNCLAVTGEDRVVISGSGGRFAEKNELKFWHPTEGTEWLSIEPHEKKVNDLAVSADGRTLVTASDDKTVAVIDITAVLTSAGVTLAVAAEESTEKDATQGKTMPTELRAGIIGLDTSHVIGFTKLLNAEDKPDELQGVRVVAAYPQGSKDIESSVSRVPKYTEEVLAMGVEIVDSIPELLKRVDVVLLESNDGRPHWEQVLPVLKAGKPVFVDKPIAGSLVDAIAIAKAAEKYEVPLFSSSVMRFYPTSQQVRGGAIGDVTGCDTYGPCILEPTHPDLFWYGIHGVEMLFTVMGPACESVERTSTEDFDVVVGKWDQGRIGTYRGARRGKVGSGGMAFGEKGTRRLVRGSGYNPLIAEIVKFFKTGKSPVAIEETIAIYTFMEAADESKRQNGATVRLADVRAKAEAQADARLDKLFPTDK